jgi:hypothetical protein
MSNYLIILNNKVINAIVADSLEIAQSVSPGKEVIESTGPTPWIDWTRSGDTWVEPETTV